MNDDGLTERISDALHHSWRGRVIATPAEQLAQEIAWEILRLRAVGREAYIQSEEEAIAHLRALGGFEADIKEDWLASALLEAAESGLLREVADLVDVEGVAPVMPGKYRVVQAYAEVHFRENRPPFIGELLQQLGIGKPQRTKDNMQEWLRASNRERVIREILTEFDLPLSAGQRGRPVRT